MKTIKLVLKQSLLLIAVLAPFSCESYELNEPGLLVPLTVDEDPSLPSISANNTMLHAETFGDPSDPMIVMLHGGPGDDYRSLLKCQGFIDDGYYVVFYDQRGSGLSMRHQADVFDGQIYIDDLEAVINYYRSSAEQKIILMGHSWGAMLAAAYVNEYPEQIEGMVLIEPGGFTWETTLEYINRSRALHLFDEGTNDYVFADQLITSDQHAALDYKVALTLAAKYSEVSVTGDGPTPFWRSGAVCNAATIQYAMQNPFDFTTDLDKYTTEVLFLYSELNQAYGIEHAKKVSSAFPNVRMEKINGAGHQIPWFGWEKYYPVALNYLNEICK